MRPLSKSLNPFEQLSVGGAWLKVQSLLKEIRRNESIDIIHANSLTAAIYVHKISDANIPMLWHERDLAKHPIIVPQIAKFATRIIAISNAVAENLKKQLGDSDKIRVILNGIDIAKFANPRSEGIPDLPSEKKKVLMAGQFVEWKGHLDFIEVAALLKKEIPDTLFILAGDTGKLGQQKHIAKLKAEISTKGLCENFIWTGFVDNMPGLLDNVDCVAVPSHGEPFGRIVVEAMAAGKPVAAYKSGALPEIIEDGVSGCLVQDGDTGSLADKILKILKDNSFATKLGEESKSRISRNFTIQRSVEEFEKLVEEL